MKGMCLLVFQKNEKGTCTYTTFLGMFLKCSVQETADVYRASYVKIGNIGIHILFREVWPGPVLWVGDRSGGVEHKIFIQFFFKAKFVHLRRNFFIQLINVCILVLIRALNTHGPALGVTEGLCCLWMQWFRKRCQIRRVVLFEIETIRERCQIRLFVMT